MLQIIKSKTFSKIIIIKLYRRGHAIITKIACDYRRKLLTNSYMCLWIDLKDLPRPFKLIGKSTIAQRTKQRTNTMQSTVIRSVS